MREHEFLTTILTNIKLDEKSGRSIITSDVQSTSGMSLQRHIQIGASVALEIVEDYAERKDNDDDSDDPPHTQSQQNYKSE